MESDPIGLRGGSFSTYNYVNNNPLSGIDPLGLGPEQPSPPTALEEAILEGDAEQAQMLAEAAGLSNAEAESAVARAAANANKLTHIFRKAGHNLDRVVKACGSEGKALQAVKDAAAKAAAGLPDGVVNGLQITVNGVIVTVNGIVINGQFNLGTGFIP